MSKHSPHSEIFFSSIDLQWHASSSLTNSAAPFLLKPEQWFKLLISSVDVVQACICKESEP